jgi:predicted phosphodiesterase
VFRITGDVHGHLDFYTALVKDVDFSVQLGDMGFNYSKLESLDPTKHRFVPGNHDNYDNLPPHAFQADWGQVVMGDLEFFYIRGAYSVDKAYRIPHRSWWPQEEMEYRSAQECIDTIAVLQPKIILSHDCPFVCYREGVLTNPVKIDPSRTTQILSAVFEVWKPELWVFGHHHNDWTKQIEGTQFVCLNELSSMDFYPDGKKVINPR